MEKEQNFEVKTDDDGNIIDIVETDNQQNIDVTKTGVRWTCRLANPEMTDEQFFEYLDNQPEVKYFCFKREKGEETRLIHFQFFIVLHNRKNWNTVKHQILPPNCWCVQSKGNATQNRNYILKRSTSIEGHKFFEGGDLTEERTRTDLINIMALAKSGMRLAQIRELYPTQAFMHKKKIVELINEYQDEKFGDVFRKMKVCYIYGKTGVHKTRNITQKYGYRNVFRVTEYDQRAFDNYEGQDIIMLEEFRNGFKISQILNYLDGHPLRLPCRYEDKTACYTKVFITTNIPIHRQYPNIQVEEPETYNAFLRRIHHIYNFDSQAHIDAFINDQPPPNPRQMRMFDTEYGLIELTEEKKAKMPF
ncbi:MAG: RNA helicase domain-containing protein [Firmicutes bacterium]|nr:RNA helicase domain-containing protein [Bacillota bacterium]